MVKFCVIYQGRPKDPEAFDRYYRENHLPIIARWPKVRKLQVSKALQLNEEHYMVAEFFFDTADDLHAALASPERKEAAEDRFHFPPFYGTIRYQILEIHPYP